MKKVSILSTFYNDIKMLKITMDSVLSQDYPNIEHIITDAGSTDGSIELLKQYEELYQQKNKMLLWKSEKDRGIYDGFNKSFRLMTGDYFIFATDPYVSSQTISIIVDTIEKFHVDGIYGGVNYLQNGKIVRKWSGKGGNWHLGWLAATPTLCLRRDCFPEKDLFNLKYKVAADYDFQVRLFKNQALKLISLKKPLVNYLAGGTSNGGIKAKWFAIKECYQILKDNHVKFAWFTNLCKTIIALFAYVFADHKTINQGGVTN